MNGDFTKSVKKWSTNFLKKRSPVNFIRLTVVMPSRRKYKNNFKNIKNKIKTFLIFSDFFITSKLFGKIMSIWLQN